MATTETSIQHYLITQSQSGDRRAQNELYKLYSKAMFNVCRRLMGNEDDALDCLQDAFITAFSKLKSLKEPQVFAAWLKRIVVNTCLNVLRKKKEQFVDVDGKDFIDETETESFDFMKMRTEEIMNAIELLPNGARTVLNLYLFEGYDHQEIGEILQITTSASKSQYSKAKSKLRMMLDPNPEYYG